MVEYEDIPTSEESRNTRNRIGLVSGIVCFIVFLLISIFFAPLGFSPTDDGYILSMSNKIIHGEIPHKDFISIRPVASSLLALYAYTPSFDSFHLLTTRIICTLEFMLIVWMWVQITVNNREIRHSTIFIVATTIIATAITIHDFPLMAWHTIDGIFFCSIALYLRSFNQNKSSNFSIAFSYIFLGISLLCKQSFAPMVIASLILFQDYKRIVPYVGILLFPLLYLVWISTNNGFFDLLVQLSAQSKLLGVGVKRYLIDYWWLGGIVIGTGLWVIHNRISASRKHNLHFITFVATVLFLLYDLTFGNHLSKSSVFLFGLVLPISVKSFIEKKDSSKIALYFVILAWSSALSIGYSFPSLVSGGMILVLLMELRFEVLTNWKITTLGILLASCFVASFINARTTKIYRDQSAQNLRYHLGEVMENGNGVYTNENTFALLKDGKSLRTFYNKTDILFAPDMAGLYSSYQNLHPSISTWARDLELPSQYLKEHFERTLNELANKQTLFAISKFAVDSLAYKFVVLNTEKTDSPVIQYAKNNLRLVDSTRFFYIYTK